MRPQFYVSSALRKGIMKGIDLKNFNREEVTAIAGIP